MSLGKVIRKYRKIRNLTQEEMAGRLGVTAPAVNKWENENSYPDITLLAPIARLLNISLDTLLSYREDLTAEEINEIVSQLNSRLKEQSYHDVFLWAKKQLEQYPNCESLIFNMAVCLDAHRMTHEVADEAQYDEYLCSLYTRLLESDSEAMRVGAADSLVGFYRRKEQYDQAEKYLEYYSIQNPEKKRQQAQIYGETGRLTEAYRTYEELLFADYQRVSAQLHGMYMLALKNKDMEKAHKLVDKLGELADCFEMGPYHRNSCRLEIATLEKDEEAILDIMEKMLADVEDIGSFAHSWLYEHMTFKEVKEEFLAELKENLLKCFCDEETYGFLKENKRWQELVKRQL